MQVNWLRSLPSLAGISPLLSVTLKSWTRFFLLWALECVPKLEESMRAMVCLSKVTVILFIPGFQWIFAFLFFRGIFWPIQPPVLRSDIWFSQFYLEWSRGTCQFICGPVCTAVWPWTANYSRTTTGASKDSCLCVSWTDGTTLFGRRELQQRSNFNFK